MLRPALKRLRGRRTVHQCVTLLILSGRPCNARKHTRCFPKNSPPQSGGVQRVSSRRSAQQSNYTNEKLNGRTRAMVSSRKKARFLAQRNQLSSLPLCRRFVQDHRRELLDKDCGAQKKASRCCPVCFDDSIIRRQGLPNGAIDMLIREAGILKSTDLDP